MSWICQYKDPDTQEWDEKEFEFKEQAEMFGRKFGFYWYVYHS